MIIAGIGAGGVYGTCVGNALKWFPDKRGLAAGITAAGFGAGSALTVAPIQAMIKDSGFQTTFLYFGLGQGILIVHPRLLPVRAKARTGARGGSERQPASDPAQLRADRSDPQPIFWLMYFMFVIVGAGGLMVTANLKPIARRLEGRRHPVTLIGLTMTAVTFAATHRPYPQRPDAAVLRLDLRHDRPREHDVHRLRHRRHRHLGALHAGPRSGLVRDPVAAWCSSPGARSTRCSPRPAPTPSARNSQPPMPACSIRPKEPRALLVPFANYMQQSSGNWDTVFLIAAGANILGVAARHRGAQAVAQERGRQVAGGLAAIA